MFFFRELASDISFKNLLDVYAFLFAVFLSKVTGLPNFWEKQRRRFMVRSVEEKYHVKIVYKDFFPPDVFWKDYFQRTDFLPIGKIVIEVGASIGVFAVVAAKFYYAEKVIAIEPDKESFAYLLKNIEINNLSDRVTPLNFAAYSTDEEISLFKSGSYLTTDWGNLKKFQLGS